MKYTENDIKEGTKLRCTKSNPSWWTVGKVYDVTLNEEVGVLHITDDYGDPVFTSYLLDCLNGKYEPVTFEIVEEEKEMRKYAKITKYEGLGYTDKRIGLEIDNEYPIVSFEDAYSKDCRIYLNEEQPHYYISEDQYELVEKEYPVATFKVDVKEVIQAKIEQLADEERKLYDKRMRIKEQEDSLHEKRMKLKEAKKALEF